MLSNQQGMGLRFSDGFITNAVLGSGRLLNLFPSNSAGTDLQLTIYIVNNNT